jgi:hypothetical protein
MNNKDDILAAFAMEEFIKPATLKTYLVRYPEFSDDLLALFDELLLVDLEAEEMIETPEAILATATHDRIAKVQTSLYGEGLRSLAQRLSLPRWFLLELHAGSVRIGSVPGQLIKNIAEQIGVRMQDVINGMQRNSGKAYAFKADNKPITHHPVDFWVYVDQASLSNEHKAALYQLTGEHGPD